MKPVEGRRLLVTLHACREEETSFYRRADPVDQLTLTQCLMLRNSYLDPLCRHHYIPKDLNYQLDSESEVAVQYTNDKPWRFCVRELQQLIRSDIESNARFYSPLKSFLSVRQQIKLHIPLRGDSLDKPSTLS